MRLLKFLSWTCVALLGAVLLGFSGTYLYLSPSLPSVETLRNVRMQVPLRVYSADDKLIAEFGEMRRSPIRFADIPQDFVDALLAAEDDNFARHYGVDVKSLMRAAAQLLTSGQIQTGGSLAGGLQQQHVLGLRDGEILGWEPQVGQVDFNVGPSRGLPPA